MKQESFFFNFKGLSVAKNCLRPLIRLKNAPLIRLKWLIFMIW